MRLVLISDTHGRHAARPIPDGDVLIHAGDFSVWSGGIDELRAIDEFFAGLPHRHKLLVAGNHDTCLETDADGCRDVLQNVSYLQDEAVELDGLKFYGSPWQPEFLDMAFNLPRGEALAAKWRVIPDDTDVLITHGPPHGIGDRVHSGDLVGCEELARRVLAMRLKLHVFGHIHESFGVYERAGTTFVNAAQASRDAEPVVFDV